MMVLVIRSVSSSVAPFAGPMSTGASCVSFVFEPLSRCMTALAMVRNMRVPGTRLPRQVGTQPTAHKIRPSDATCCCSYLNAICNLLYTHKRGIKAR
jgi:hypothetical protein